MFVVLIVLGLALIGTHRLSVAPNCARATVVLSGTRAVRNTSVRWIVTGPARDRVVLVVGAATVGADGSLRPPAGTPSESVQLGGGPAALTGCRITGAFVVRVPPGDYPVTLTRLGPGGGTPIARTALEVVAS